MGDISQVKHGCGMAERCQQKILSITHANVHEIMIACKDKRKRKEGSYLR